jgi:putative tricarboxylic transport membrane protein
VSDTPTKEERRPDRAALVIAALLAGLAAVIAVNTYNLPSGVASYSRVGPRAFPYTMAACIALIALATLRAALHRDFPAREKDDVRPILWVIGGLVVQIALLKASTGFAVATGAVFAATAMAFGRGPLWFTYPVGVILSMAIWLAFATGLNLVLPAGPPEHFMLDLFRSLFAMLSGGGPAPVGA